MQVFVINLERRRDRRQLISEQLTTFGMDFKFIKAVDFKEIDITDATRPFLSRLFRGFKETNPAPVAIFLSHKSIWQEIEDTGIPYALILEDDAGFVDWDSGILQVKLENYKLDMLRLGAGSLENSVTKKPLKISGIQILGRNLSFDQTAGACAYIVTKEGASKMLKCRKFYFPVDAFHAWNKFYRLRSALLTPFMISQIDSTSDRQQAKKLRKYLFGKSLMRFFVRYAINRHLSTNQ